MGILMEDGESASLKIRYFVYGLLQKNLEKSIRIPSSYELAGMFGTTRRIAQCELERLAKDGILITRPRIGTFTNPASNYSYQTFLDGPMPLIGVIYSQGDFFKYSGKSAMTIGEVFRSLALHNCNTHDIRLSSHQREKIFEEIASRRLDGIIWCLNVPEKRFFCGFRPPENLNISLLSEDSEGEYPGVYSMWNNVSKELTEIFLKENRRKLFFSGLHLHSTETIYDCLGKAGIYVKKIQAHGVQELYEKTIAAIDLENPPDVIFCEDGIAAPVQHYLDEHSASYGGDPNRVRLVLMRDTFRPDFRGYVLFMPYAEAAEKAVKIVLDGIGGRSAGAVTRAEVEMQLKKINI